MNYFVTATDTDAGKTVVTALIANYFEQKNKSTITQKWIQTGNVNISEDLEYHLKFMNKNLKDYDQILLKQKMCPYIFKLPASPHLSAKYENVKIEKNKIIESYEYLTNLFKTVIVEGSGGVLVPYNDTDFLLDIAKELKIPVIIVSMNRLGTINHTLLTIEALKARGLRIKGIVFNNKIDTKSGDKLILEDNIETILAMSGVEILGEVKYNKNKIALIENFDKIGKKLE
jgi:dethiobiotin synthetase